MTALKIPNTARIAWNTLDDLVIERDDQESIFLATFDDALTNIKNQYQIDYSFYNRGKFEKAPKFILHVYTCGKNDENYSDTINYCDKEYETLHEANEDINYWMHFFDEKVNNALDKNYLLNTKRDIVLQIKTVFAKVTLEDGIGLWQAQGIDDYADELTIQNLKAKDEKENWQNIPYQDLINCASSLSFFDAKGMRFCLPQFIIFDLEAQEMYKGEVNPSPDVTYTLGNTEFMNYFLERFSLFNSAQIQTIISYLEYKIKETVHFNNKTVANNIKQDLEKTLYIWKQKMMD